MPAVADEQVNKTIDASPDGYVEIYNTSGSIEVTGWDRDEIEIKGTLGDSVEELVVERDGNRRDRLLRTQCTECFRCSNSYIHITVGP